MSGAPVEERVARLEALVEHQADTLDAIAADLKILTAAMNRGKGALAAIITISGLAGAAISALIPLLFGKA